MAVWEAEWSGVAHPHDGRGCEELCGYCRSRVMSMSPSQEKTNTQNVAFGFH